MENVGHIEDLSEHALKLLRELYYAAEELKLEGYPNGYCFEATYYAFYHLQGFGNMRVHYCEIYSIPHWYLTSGGNIIDLTASQFNLKEGYIGKNENLDIYTENQFSSSKVSECDKERRKQTIIQIIEKVKGDKMTHHEMWRLDSILK